MICACLYVCVCEGKGDIYVVRVIYMFMCIDIYTHCTHPGWGVGRTCRAQTCRCPRAHPPARIPAPPSVDIAVLYVCIYLGDVVCVYVYLGVDAHTHIYIHHTITSQTYTHVSTAHVDVPAAPTWAPGGSAGRAARAWPKETVKRNMYIYCVYGHRSNVTAAIFLKKEILNIFVCMGIYMSNCGVYVNT